MDFLATYAAEHIDGGLIASELQTILGCHVSLAKDLEGKDTKANAGSQGSLGMMTSSNNISFTPKVFESVLKLYFLFLIRNEGPCKCWRNVFRQSETKNQYGQCWKGRKRWIEEVVRVG